MGKNATLCILLVLAAALGTRAQDDQVFKFKKALPTKGMTFALAHQRTMNMDVEATIPDHPPFNSTMAMKEHQVSEQKILAVSEVGVTKLSFSMKKHEETESQNMGGQERNKSESDPRLGKTFIVELKDGKVDVSAPEGGEVPADVRGAFEKEMQKGAGLGRLFDPCRGLDGALAGKELKVGDKVELSSEQLEKLMHGEGENDGSMPEVKKAILTVQRAVNYLGTDCVAFSADFEFSGTTGQEQNPMNVGAHLEGEYLVGLGNCWIYKANLSGPMSMNSVNAGHGGMNIAGKGKMDMTGNVIVSQGD
ncbi:MAG: hypothetical protein H6807_08050 [Planctomycetes bacterium]|nr:hypothetical protein [Planctomycetota bacterium]